MKNKKNNHLGSLMITLKKFVPENHRDEAKTFQEDLCYNVVGLSTSKTLDKNFIDFTLERSNNVNGMVNVNGYLYSPISLRVEVDSNGCPIGGSSMELCAQHYNQNTGVFSRNNWDLIGEFNPNYGDFIISWYSYNGVNDKGLECDSLGLPLSESVEENYIYEEGDYHCDKCGVLGDFNGGGVGYDGVERVIICGEVFEGDDGCYCDKCIGVIKQKSLSESEVA